MSTFENAADPMMVVYADGGIPRLRFGLTDDGYRPGFRGDASEQMISFPAKRVHRLGLTDRRREGIKSGCPSLSMISPDNQENKD